MQLSFVSLFLLCFIGSSHGSLQSEVEGLVKRIGSVTGYAISVGYKDADVSFGVGAGQRDPVNFPTRIGGNTTSSDRFLFGSGTKPFTAVAVLRLVEKGVIRSLDDPAHLYVDRVLKNEGLSMEKLLGRVSLEVTVGHLLKMQSGVADFDVPKLDNDVLDSNHWTPLTTLGFVSSLNDTICNASRTGECPCRFMCKPGHCVSYSSTNYVLAGLVLAGATNKTAWTGFDTDMYRETLGFDGGVLADLELQFATTGPLNKNGLTVAGSSVQYGKEELWKQDSSILGHACGNCIGSAHDVARFYWEVLGPNPTLLPAATVAMMQDFHTLNAGWAAGGLRYGLGLMIQNVSPRQNNESYHTHHGPAPLNMSGSYVGHAGDTYAFQSDNGFFPAYNASISVVVNQDYDPPAEMIVCNVLQVVARHRGDPVDFGCEPVPKVAMYSCMKSFGEPVCVEMNQAHHGEHKGNLTQLQCNQTCH